MSRWSAWSRARRVLPVVAGTTALLLTCGGSAAAEVVAPRWQQEFTGPAGMSPDPDVWRAMNLAGGWGNRELQAYTPRRENVATDGKGSLRLTARAEQWTDPKGNRARYTSARVESVEAFRYGRFEARILVPKGQGLWSAFWTVGTERDTVGWPAVGEIDIVELMNDTGEANLNAHGPTTRGGRWTDPTAVATGESYGGEWHVYRLDWTADRLIWAVDGVERHTVSRADLGRDERWPFDRAQHLVLNLAVGGNWPGAPNATTTLPADMLVDWVRVYDPSVIGG